MPYEFRGKKTSRKRRDCQSTDVAKKIYEMLCGGNVMSLNQIRDTLSIRSSAVLRNAMTVCTAMCPIYELEENGNVYYGLIKDVWH